MERGYSSVRNAYVRWLSDAAYGLRFATEEAMFDAAMENLEQFAFIGITEHYDVSVQRLCERFGLEVRPTRQAHKTVASIRSA